MLTRVFLALTNLMNDGQDAEAYTLQVNAKQEEFLQKVDRTRRSRRRRSTRPWRSVLTCAV